MKIRMQLISDVVFGNGESIPGGEDISILGDEHGFPYYKGGTFKGIFREELRNYLTWTMTEADKIDAQMKRLLGADSDDKQNPDKLVFSDFTLSEYVKQQILAETGIGQKYIVQNALSHVRTFTAMSANGLVQEGALRQCRCVNKGLNFYSQVQCLPVDEELVKEVLSTIKWVGTMRNRGFGKVKLTVIS